MIPVEEINSVKESVIKVIRYSQGINDPNVDDLLTNWATNKEHYYHLFHNRLIYEFPDPVTFNLSETVKNYKVDNLIDRVENFYHSSKLADFISDEKSNFFENKVRSDKHIAPKGMKLIKAFKFFEEDKETLQAIQNEASMLIQENKVTGKLCISIHPLDFLSSSENNENWRSCHALDGDYRAGNLSYIADTATFICYLKTGDEEVSLSAFGPVQWNSKRWRMLIHGSVDHLLMFAGRQYPFFSQDGLDKIYNILNNFIRDEYPDCSYYPWRSDYLDQSVYELSDRWFVAGQNLLNINRVVLNKGVNFNDLLCSSVYETPYYITLHHINPYILDIYNGPDISPEEPVVVGYPVKCLCCGEGEIEEPTSMLCEDCDESEDALYCECCGRRIHGDNFVVVDDAYIVCSDCADNGSVIECDYCGDYFFEEDITYLNNSHKCCCKYCLCDCEEEILLDEEENKNNG